MLGSGRSEPDFKVNIAIGNTPWLDSFFVTGILDTDALTWKLFSPLPVLQNLPHKQLTTLSKVKLASTSTLDNPTGIGAYLVGVVGLGEFSQVQQEVVILDGQNEVETLLEWTYVAEITVLPYGIGSNTDLETGDLVAVGDIYCGTGTFALGIPQYPITGISFAENNLNSREAIFQVPDGFYMLMKGLFCTVDPDKNLNTSIDVQLAINLFGTPDNQWYKSTPNSYNCTLNYVPESLLLLPPRTRIQYRGRMAKLKSTRATIEASVQLIAASRISFG